MVEAGLAAVMAAAGDGGGGEGGGGDGGQPGPWRRGRDLAHEMQTAGELAGLEGTISLWRT